MSVGAVCGKTGKSGWTILDKAQSARFGTVNLLSYAGNDLSSMLYNPSLLVTKSRRELFFISELGFVDDKFGGLVYAEPLTGGVASFGIVYYDAGQIELNWIENGEVMSENVSAQKDLLGVFSYGFKFEDDLLLGASLKLASSEIAQKASAFAVAMDFGGFYSQSENLYFSAALRNLGAASKFIDSSNSLPASLYTGCGYYYSWMEYFFMPALGFAYNFTDSVIVPETGFEFGYSLFSFNLGYRFNVEESNLHLGFNVKWNDMNFGYAFVPGSELGSIHRVNIGYKFGETHNYDNYDLLLRPKGLKFEY
jgi:hypothetical protein